jgi:hypothetical protein
MGRDAEKISAGETDRDGGVSKVGDATVRTAPQLPAFRNFHVRRKSA